MPSGQLCLPPNLVYRALWLPLAISQFILLCSLVSFGYHPICSTVPSGHLWLSANLFHSALLSALPVNVSHFPTFSFSCLCPALSFSQLCLYIPHFPSVPSIQPCLYFPHFPTVPSIELFLYVPHFPTVPSSQFCLYVPHFLSVPSAQLCLYVPYFLTVPSIPLCLSSHTLAL